MYLAILVRFLKLATNSNGAIVRSQSSALANRTSVGSAIVPYSNGGALILANSASSAISQATQHVYSVNDTHNLINVVGKLATHELRQARIFDNIYGGGGSIDFPTAMPGIEGTYTTSQGATINVSFKDGSQVRPEKLFNFRSKIHKAIYKAQDVIDRGIVHKRDTQLFFNLNQASSEEVLNILNMTPETNSTTTLDRLKTSPFNRILFEAKDGIFEVDRATGKLVKL
jgi:hypothetical protein